METFAATAATTAAVCGTARPRPALIVIPCGAAKQDRPARADQLYIGSYFRQAHRWATSRQPDVLLILSAEHGLLTPDTVIAPYDRKLGQPGSVTVDIVATQAASHGWDQLHPVETCGGKTYRQLVRRLWPDATSPVDQARSLVEHLQLLAAARKGL